MGLNFLKIVEINRWKGGGRLQRKDFGALKPLR